MLHAFDNGTCTTCMPETERNFDPNEPRDPHTGKWGHGGGMPESIVDSALKVAGGTLNVSADPNTPDRATLSTGGRSISLNARDIEGLRLATISAKYDQTEHAGSDGVYRVIRRDRSGSIVHLLSLRPVQGKYVSETGKKFGDPADAPDDEEWYNAEFDLVIGEGSDTDFNDEPSVRVDLKDIDSGNRRGLYATLLNATAARRVDTGNGPTDVFVPRPGAVGVRMKDDAGKPAEAVFNARDYRRISAAISDVIYGEGEGLDPTELAGERDARKVVETSAGPVEIRFNGSHQEHAYGPDSSLTIIPQYKADWGIAASGNGISNFADAFASNGDMAGLGPR